MKNIFRIWGIISFKKLINALEIVLVVIFLPSCMAQQTDSARIQKDLELQIAKIKNEKQTLGLQVDEVKAQLIKMNEEAQKTRGNLATINQKATLLQEKDVASLYGKFEEAEQSVKTLREDFTNQMELVNSEVQSLQKSLQMHNQKVDALAQHVNKDNQELTAASTTKSQDSPANSKEERENLESRVKGQRENFNSQQADIMAQSKEFNGEKKSEPDISPGTEFSIDKTSALKTKGFNGKVISILDGDTIKILSETKEELTIQLNGIDCPERDQVYGKEAKEFTKNLVLSLKVLIRPSKKDIRQTIADVILEDGRNLSQELIKAGYAWWSFENSTDELLAHLESKAKIEKVGLWANPDPIPPWIFRQQLKASIQKHPSNTPIPFEPEKKLIIPEKIQSQSSRKSIGQKCYNAVVMEPRPFLGNGGEMFVLDDGTIWKEVSYQFLYLYEYNPNVIVCPSTGEMTLGEHVFEIVQVN